MPTRPSTTAMSVTFMGTLTPGSASVSGISSTTGLVVGQSVTGTGIPSGTTIQAVNSSTAITLSAPATVTGPQSSRPRGVWLVQTTSLVPASPAPPPFWFTSGTAFGPANVIPFQGDFDGDGYTDLAYYQSSTATWFMNDSKTLTCRRSSWARPTQAYPWSAISTPMPGLPVDASTPEEAAVFTIANGQGVWTIASRNSGIFAP